MKVKEAALGQEGTSPVIAERLRSTVGRFVRSVRTQVDTPTTSQSETLLVLEQNGPLSIADMATLRNVRHQSMRLVSAQLEAEGLVSRMPNPTDRRSQLLSITEKGRERLSQSREARTLKIATLIEERLTDEERRVLEAAIQIIDRLC
ncbi:MarR family transcriptional regulator [Rhizobium sp. SSA_523]|uniref:MarR family transcriptional regulator n=1 Tax=Rhizobium sp. SSA_523 TaxID=2952477 RepID=UPI002091CD54|nr:MarR family transcriptional regulator [Rhizobium sp. SSA_523]MCO5734307.1 MarR family transcriptional regulator [Rhizobium sp. SSA_523]WKC21033.1 MarR family transcriptional regulator [Rhizobium sp. SSA_523]